jgi:serine/threonine protein kinase
MNQLLKLNQTIRLKNHLNCLIKAYLGGGGQGEVYQAELNGVDVALKWYYPHLATAEQQLALTELIQKKAPNTKFLWPLSLAEAANIQGFGYFMPLRESRYQSIVDLMKRRAEPNFRQLITATIELADSFLQLHAKGLCYQDISFGNVFFDPDNGQILICDNDNVTTNRKARSQTMMGTPRFMSPEIVLGKVSAPSTESDLFSLSVLLFYMLMLHHPLEGRKEAAIKCFDLPAMTQLYGSEPVFIFDPEDESNRPLAGYQDNPLLYWKIYPQFIKDLFVKAFTKGLHDPQHGRVRESEWRATLLRLRDAIFYCQHCRSENFYDPERLKTGQQEVCWGCQQALPTPPRIKIQQPHHALVVMLNYDTTLFAYHIDSQSYYGFSEAVAQVNQHPQNPTVWGLKNLTTQPWTATTADGSVKTVTQGQTIALSHGLILQFGQSSGEIRF